MNDINYDPTHEEIESWHLRVEAAEAADARRRAKERAKASAKVEAAIDLSVAEYRTVFLEDDGTDLLRHALIHEADDNEEFDWMTDFWGRADNGKTWSVYLMPRKRGLLKAGE